MDDTDQTVTDITACDREPIHIPGSIQPHGILLVVDPALMTTVGEAGDIARFIPDYARGFSLVAVLGQALADEARDADAGKLTALGRIQTSAGQTDAVAYRSGAYLIVELEQAESAPVEPAPFLLALDAATMRFERTISVNELCREGADMFRSLTGYDRVLIYQFLDDDAGVVIAESHSSGVSSFLNHHFPASDIPRQARALYIRNRSRVIPDVDYQPRPIQSDRDLRQLDLSDSTLRSVSPVHIQYLKNMGVAASASISIVKDGILWGLIACHHSQPRAIPLTTRLGCQALANGLSRQIRAKEDAELYRERLRLRSQEDLVLAKADSDGSLDAFLEKSGAELASLLTADGFAAVQGKDLFIFGTAPDRIDLRRIADHVRIPAATQPFSSSSLSRQWPEAEGFRQLASGLLAVTMSTEVPTVLMWFRAEKVELVEWAGNPHKNVEVTPGAQLQPRASFETWVESVRGKAPPWSHAEIEAATRIARLMLEQRNNKRLRDLNRELSITVRENETLLKQKDFLLKEVNHRVQNSLQLVSAFLRLQARDSKSPDIKQSLDEAQKRLNAVALVHRRLYQDDSIEVIDLARYIETLLVDTLQGMDQGWKEQLTVDLAPVLIATDRAVNIGLVLTELVINAQKYAYEGSTGPLTVKLEQHRGMMRLIVSDRGQGKQKSKAAGFGSRMLSAIVERLGGDLDEEDNMPGLRVILTAPIQMEKLG
ncbi:histidine kinase dimerization/phosphoacceptor domain -containing protein [Rhizobium sp. SSA_523]|uniref:histidine kinase dimerization/phosphoacceptor domain -containing protein n=1 Tax=Rhizobium sp. SSA_523 TaxID=2952477 RepID=UPI0020911554|nr:histidine kinase dimerization/phosphoacceptor domain -containing protein [Rhizobium sp. SSA_523]MCO5732847.1 GAF domain-containing protein [Rhizobium sp. SSA_523]WKC23536.1 histidine kinase dimerization/phosphoacceptor domain -containing protein [Rhizobium sp. SSA_523]